MLKNYLSITLVAILTVAGCKRNGSSLGLSRLDFLQKKLKKYILEGNTSKVNEMIRKGAAVNAIYKDGQRPLHWAAYWGREELVKLLLDKGADVEAKDRNGSTSLHQAAYEGHQEVAKYLIEQGAAVEATEENGWTPLHWGSFQWPKRGSRILDRAGCCGGGNR